MSPRKAWRGSLVARRLGRLLPVASWLAAQSAIAPPAVAAPVPLARPAGLQFIEVSPPACKPEAFALVPFLDSLRVELAVTGIRCCMLAEPNGAVTSAVPLRVKVETAPCGSDRDTVQIAVQDDDSARVVHRELSLADVVPTARPRTLALAVAELVRSLGQQPPNEAPKTAVTAEVHAPAPPASPASRAAVHVEGEARVLPTRDTLMWGARARMGSPWRSLHVDFDLGVDQASRRVDLGTVQVRCATAGLAVGPRLASSIAILDLGVRAELGWAWIRGDTSLATVQAEAGSDLVASLGLRTAVEFPARSSFRASLALEGGGFVHGTKGEADGRSVVGMTGYYALVSVGIAVSP